MNIFKKAKGILFAKDDLAIVINYVKAGLKSELDSIRIRQNKGISISMNDELLNKASKLVESVVNDFDEIKKRTNRQKTLMLKSKKLQNMVLSPDENYAIEMSAIKDIKKAKLKRSLTAEERSMLKEATRKFNVVYSEQLKIYKQKEKLR